MFVRWFHKLLFIVRMSYLRAYTDPSLCLSIISVCQPVLSYELSCWGKSHEKKKKKKILLCLSNHEELQSELNNRLFETPSERRMSRAQLKKFVLGEFAILSSETVLFLTFLCH